MNSIAKEFAPIISSKIYKEYAYSFDYEKIKYNSSSLQIIEVTSAVDSSVHHTVNILLRSCTCGRCTYKGIPCSHLYAAWRFTAKDLEQETFSTVNKHWFLKYYQSDKSDSSSSTTYPHLPPNKINLPPFHLNNSSANSKNSSTTFPLNKRKYDQFNPNISANNFKAIKVDNPQKVKKNFSFIEATINSCRFDALLAFLTFFVNSEGRDILVDKTHSQKYIIFEEILIKSIDKINNHDFINSQRDFIKICSKYLKEKNTKEFGSLARLFLNLFDKDVSEFNTEFTTSPKCSNQRCPGNIDKQLKIFGPFISINFEEKRNISPGLLQNWYHYSYIEYSDTDTCVYCNNLGIQTCDIQTILIRSPNKKNWLSYLDT